MMERLAIVGLVAVWYVFVRQFIVYLVFGDLDGKNRNQRFDRADSVMSWLLAIPATVASIFFAAVVLGFIVYGGR